MGLEQPTGFSHGCRGMAAGAVLLLILAAGLFFAHPAGATSSPAADEGPPNFVIIFADDLGYGDIGPFGAEKISTPNLDRMAAEGAKFTDFYVTAPSCSPSRAGLMTGSYNQRVSIPRVLNPRDRIGLHPDEVTIAEVLQQQGYATACIGKWHLGHLEPFLPTNHGFDEFFGLPYSNDMSPDPANNPRPRARQWPPLPLMKGTAEEGVEVIETEPDQRLLTKRYTEHALEFIDRNRENPFFLYLPSHAPHVPLFASDDFDGKSERGSYGDVVEELDWSVGQILDKLEASGLEEQTLVIFTSDNGPWHIMGDDGGDAGPLRGAKASIWEGGMRVPTVMRWPGHIPAGTVCSEVATTMDFLPTFAALAGAEAPAGRVIDGQDIRPLLRDPEHVQGVYDGFFYYQGDRQLRAVRSGPWKLVLPFQGHPELELFDLQRDIGETTDVSAENPQVVERLQGLLEQMRDDIGDSVQERQGENVRPAGRI